MSHLGGQSNHWIIQFTHSWRSTFSPGFVGWSISLEVVWKMVGSYWSSLNCFPSNAPRRQVFPTFPSPMITSFLMSLTFPAAIIKNNLLFDLFATTGKEASRDLSTYHLSGTFINFTDTLRLQHSSGLVTGIPKWLNLLNCFNKPLLSYLISTSQKWMSKASNALIKFYHQ